MSDKTLKTWRKLGGEYLREISVLVLVFGFLDGFRDNSLDVENVLLILSISLAGFVVGGILHLSSE